MTLLKAFDAKDLRIKLKTGKSFHAIVEIVNQDGATFRSIGNSPDDLTDSSSATEG